ncbi:MAG TPA: DUF3365 domain-containing protein [Acetobacteraceae bacterium]|nr:DUF3365 domain-containing protein [Acetobacteraceae bacterium]
MGLKAKFNLVMLVAFVIGLGLAAVFCWGVTQRNARDEVVRTAALMADQAAAVRGYTDKQIGPLLAEQSSVRFLPQTIPFFAAQSVLRSLQTQYPDYAYKEAALNPTNPADRATDWQADLINTFERDPKLTQLVTVRETPTGPTLNLARPIEVGDKSCLACHSTPQVAPPSMVDLYGTANGFGWKLDSIIGAQVVTVPMQLALTKARHLFFVVMGGLTAVFVVMLVLLNLLLHYFIIRPVRRISAVASEVSLGNLDVPEYRPRGGDEIASLAESFNRMRRSLANALRLLETAE